MNNRLPKIVFFTLIAISVSATLFYYNQLPARIASHFNFKGEADGWMNKEDFLIFNFAMLLGLSVLFALIDFLIKKGHDSMISLPNKEFWLAPSRRNETILSLRRFAVWIANLTLAFLTLTFNYTYRLNLNRIEQFGWEFWLYFAGYLAGVFFLIIKLFIRFHKKRIE